MDEYDVIICKIVYDMIIYGIMIPSSERRIKYLIFDCRQS